MEDCNLLTPSIKPLRGFPDRESNYNYFFLGCDGHAEDFVWDSPPPPPPLLSTLQTFGCFPNADCVQCRRAANGEGGAAPRALFSDPTQALRHLAALPVWPGKQPATSGRGDGKPLRSLGVCVGIEAALWLLGWCSVSQCLLLGKICRLVDLRGKAPNLKFRGRASQRVLTRNLP